VIRDFRLKRSALLDEQHMADSHEQQGQHKEPFPHVLSEVCTRYQGAEESVQTEPTQHRPETIPTAKKTVIFWNLLSEIQTAIPAQFPRFFLESSF